MGKQATIRDVAALAGVSVATASRALNDPSYPVNAQLRQQVKEAAERLNYVPNLMARSLRRGGYNDIGLVIPNISNPFYLQTMLGIDDVLTKNGYSMILCNTMRDAEQERKCLRQLYERQVKGVILSSWDENADVIKKYARMGMKFVLLDQKLSGVECPGINFDSRAGARMAVEYLLSHGHQRIVFATTPMTRWTRMEMYRGYCDALIAAKAECGESLVYAYTTLDTEADSDYEFQAGRHIAEDFLADGCPASAILCINDMVAIGVIRTLMRHGVRVPEDVSVVGFDDIPFANAFWPALTTVRYPALETGRLAALMMLDIISNTASEMTLSMNLSPSLVLRDTVAVEKRYGPASPQGSKHPIHNFYGGQ